jgi:transposase
MLAFPAAIRIYVAVRPVDMRKSFNGLWSAVSEQLREDPKSGAVYCFVNKDRTRVKLLYWDGTGVWVLAKRLEQGRFSWTAADDDRKDRARTGGVIDARQRGGSEARHAEAVVRTLIRKVV